MLTLSSDDVVTARYRVVHHPKVCIRAGPSLGSRIIGVVKCGTVVDSCGGDRRFPPFFLLFVCLKS
eukprot:SAG31_NODE_376_length_16541_cov_4.520922_2_plen_66_part_00